MRGPKISLELVAIEAMIHVALNTGTDSHAIERHLGLQPRGFERLGQKLVAAGLLTSRSGQGGGYRLGRPADKITLWQIVAVAQELSVDPLARHKNSVAKRILQEAEQHSRAFLRSATLAGAVELFSAGESTPK